MRVDIYVHGVLDDGMTEMTRRWRLAVRGQERSIGEKMRKKFEEAWPEKQARLRRMEAARRAGKVLKFDSHGQWIEE